ncbi:hypothetical protein GJ744_006545 [Endocarpon pusillum]|uniref:RNB domain-containing protein n=1 Tax=Endocarpon pusillum TaxID=364733 RepID=A0A8H7AVI7_9EURO|nr:hypothetical protein GJ744_006545 [Endocarpon pusillum]
MRPLQKAAASRNYYRLILESESSRRRPFVCADCRRLLQERRFATDGHTSAQRLDSRRWKKYHTSSKDAAALENHSNAASDNAFFIVDKPSHVSPNQHKEAVPSIRQRLRQWRKDNDTSATSTGSADPEYSKPPGDLSTQIHIPAPNSLVTEESQDDLEGANFIDHDPDPLREYRDDWTAAVSRLNSGDLLELTVPGSTGISESLCICVRSIEIQAQFITSKGYWYVASDYKLNSGKISNFASSDDLAPIIPYLPDTVLQQDHTQGYAASVGDMPIDIAAPIVSKLAQVEQDIDTFERRYASAFDGMYEMLAHDTELVEWDVEDLVPRVFGIPYNELTTAGRLALDRFAARANHDIFRSQYSAETLGFWVRSRRDVQMRKTVIEWARMYQESAAKAALGKDVKEDLRNNPLNAFINKAHRLILKSRKIRSPTTIGLLGPSAESDAGVTIIPVDTGETLTKNDRLIVRFIFETSQMVPPLVPPEAKSICALIYRAIGAYPNLTLGRKVARLLLQELGVISPWSNRAANSYQLRLPGLGIWPYQDRLKAKAEASCKDLSVFQDSVQHARKDWGHMSVYCIDSQSAQEVDDGISIESARNMPDCAWIHIHIANPAAYISPNHPIATMAKDALHTTYTPSRKYGMMPSNFAQELASLGAANDRPVMTVSTLLRADGSIADIEMSLGTIHNVITLTPSAVQNVLEEKRTELATMVIGGARPAQEDVEKDSQKLKQALPDLLRIRQFLHARYYKRQSDWPAEEKMKRKEITVRSDVWTSLREEALPILNHKIRHWKGDPIITIEADRFPRTEENFDFMLLVEHAMLLAGESASKWCKDREIPIIHLTATPHPLFPVSRLNELSDSDYRLEPKGRTSVTPQPHWPLNMWHYTRVTSPIRRYPDLVNQWQIQAYLQAINHKFQDPESADPLRDLPFTRQELEDMIGKMRARLPMLKHAARQCDLHFLHQAFFRAFHFKEAELPEVWDFKVMGAIAQNSRDNISTGITGYLHPFQAQAELLPSVEKWETSVARGQYLPVKIEVVDAEVDKVFVRAVGPPSQSLTTTQPIHIQSSKTSISPGKHSPQQQQR